jgi:hypothetical protein
MGSSSQNSFKLTTLSILQDSLNFGSIGRGVLELWIGMKKKGEMMGIYI